MASGAHRAWRPAVVGWLVLGLTPGSARAAPPAVEQSEARADSIGEAASEERRPGIAPALVVGTVGLASLATAIGFTIRSAEASRSLAADLDARVQYDQHDRRL
ncbi:MAG TPA: hypothetical protein VK034_01620, partial [Enhygromyxa sp.]|nr:hypothetical protein [Enhygromyxa sp.]